MGFSKNVSEKACFMTQNKGVEKAMDWCTQNMESPDYEDELFIVGSTGPIKKPSAVSNMTPEEKREYAIKL